MGTVLTSVFERVKVDQPGARRHEAARCEVEGGEAVGCEQERDQGAKPELHVRQWVKESRAAVTPSLEQAIRQFIRDQRTARTEADRAAARAARSQASARRRQVMLCNRSRPRGNQDGA